MVMIALCSSLIGTTLGTRFRVLVLIPAIMLGVLLVAATALVKGSALSSAIGAIAVWAVFLQLGYVGGLLTRHVLEVTGLAPQRPFHSTTTRS
jgi:hypothetical protein